MITKYDNYTVLNSAGIGGMKLFISAVLKLGSAQADHRKY